MSYLTFFYNIKMYLSHFMPIVPNLRPKLTPCQWAEPPGTESGNKAKQLSLTVTRFGPKEGQIGPKVGQIRVFLDQISVYFGSLGL